MNVNCCITWYIDFMRTLCCLKRTGPEGWLSHLEHWLLFIDWGLYPRTLLTAYNCLELQPQGPVPLLACVGTRHGCDAHMASIHMHKPNRTPFFKKKVRCLQVSARSLSLSNVGHRFWGEGGHMSFSRGHTSRVWLWTRCWKQQIPLFRRPVCSLQT